MVERLAAFVEGARWEDLSASARLALELRILDSLGCAIGALDAEPIAALSTVIDEFGGPSYSTLLGRGCAAPDRASLFNGALVRYLDFNDAYLAKGETCHPSDAFAAVLAAAEYAGSSGRDLLVALAVAYAVHCRLSDIAPVRDRGFDHTVHGAYAVAAGVSKALGLDAPRTANAVAISGTAFNALRVTRTGGLSHWKGLAYPCVAAGATLAAFLARDGITGPREVFEGNKGLMDTITGPFVLDDWTLDDLERVQTTVLKRYCGEIHAQSAIEAALELRAALHAPPESDFARVEIDVFDVAHEIIGGGEEGDKTIVSTKEQADHSLPYMVAVALLDGRLMPEQYTRDRIASRDVQDLLRRIVVRPSEELSRHFPEEHGCRVRVVLREGPDLATTKRDYEGFHTRPMTTESVARKFDDLAGAFVDPGLRARIVEAVLTLDELSVSELCAALAEVAPTRRPLPTQRISKAA